MFKKEEKSKEEGAKEAFKNFMERAKKVDPDSITAFVGLMQNEEDNGTASGNLIAVGGGSKDIGYLVSVMATQDTRMLVTMKLALEAAEMFKKNKVTGKEEGAKDFLGMLVDLAADGEKKPSSNDEETCEFCGGDHKTPELFKIMKEQGIDMRAEVAKAMGMDLPGKDSTMDMVKKTLGLNDEEMVELYDILHRFDKLTDKKKKK